jgi:hypothetical protein
MPKRVSYKYENNIMMYRQKRNKTEQEKDMNHAQRTINLIDEFEACIWLVSNASA